MSMRMSMIAASEQECDALYTVEPLHRKREALSKMNDFSGRYRRQILKIWVMLPRDNLRVPPPNGMNVGQSKHELSLPYDVSTSSTLGYATEDALPVMVETFYPQEPRCCGMQQKQNEGSSPAQKSCRPCENSIASDSDASQPAIESRHAPHHRS